MTRTLRVRPSPAARSLIATAAGCLLALACSDGGSGSSAPTPSKPAVSKPAASKPAVSKPAASKPADAEPAAAQATGEESAAASPPPSPADLAKRGRSIYMANCIACHNQNPTQDGALGPAIAGSSRELIEARVMRAEYPPGYTPKRESKVMVALPHLQNELDALAAYLAQAS
jgi:mono/diheme cytochrome c family protein